MLRTKAQLLTDLQGLTSSAGGSLLNLGGDCYAAVVADEVRVAVAIKESTLEKKLWVGSPVPILRLLTGDTTFLPQTVRQDVTPWRAFILLTHSPAKTVLLIPLMHVYTDIVTRARANRAPERTEFQIHRTGYKRYELMTEELRENTKIANIDTLQPIERLLSITYAELEDQVAGGSGVGE